ncbi:MAG TPA: hypothetical protein VNH64_11855, partial [Parvularculaceae bacterium]|nr:hypothetical protein [Parvularculaceae bacterium]
RRFQSLAMKRASYPVNYNSMIQLGADDAYLYLSAFLPCRPSHPPLKIPLADLSRSDERVFFLTRAVLRTQRAPDVNIMMSRSLADWILGGAAAA